MKLTALVALALGAVPAAAQEGWEVGPGVRLSHKGADFEMHLNSYVQGDLRSRQNFTDGDDEEEGLNGTARGSGWKGSGSA